MRQRRTGVLGVVAATEGFDKHVVTDSRAFVLDSVLHVEEIVLGIYL